MTEIEFVVKGRPPRKDGANSFWSTDEANRIVELRKRAFQALFDAQINLPITSKVNLELVVYSPNITDRKNSRTYVGDMDTFIAGICDALQAADKKAKINPIFNDIPEIDPSKSMIKDDSQIVSIMAKKITDTEERYSIIMGF